jgi:hypothetical protein
MQEHRECQKLLRDRIESDQRGYAGTVGGKRLGRHGVCGHFLDLRVLSAQPGQRHPAAPVVIVTIQVIVKAQCDRQGIRRILEILQFEPWPVTTERHHCPQHP